MLAQFVTDIPDFREARKTLDFATGFCEDMIHSNALPGSPGLEVVQRYVFHETRCHVNFARELRGLSGRLTWSPNTLNIMSNRIPDMRALTTSRIAYRIPASQATFQELLQRCSQMAYFVGRVCAIAGDTDMYRERDLHPEGYNAEESYDDGGLTVINALISQPIKYRVLNATKGLLIMELRVSWLSRLTHASGSCLIHSRASSVQPAAKFSTIRTLVSIYVSSILPGISVDAYICVPWNVDQEIVLLLLYSPLPADLTTIQRDIIVSAAAYCGDFGGICYSASFASWWSFCSAV